MNANSQGLMVSTCPPHTLERRDRDQPVGLLWSISRRASSRLRGHVSDRSQQVAQLVRFHEGEGPLHSAGEVQLDVTG